MEKTSIKSNKKMTKPKSNLPMTKNDGDGDATKTLKWRYNKNLGNSDATKLGQCPKKKP
jgi:P pilus assembly chaperone PapD